MGKVYFVYLFWIFPLLGCHVSVSNPASPSPSPLRVMLPDAHARSRKKKKRKEVWCTYGLSPTCAGRVATDSRRHCIGRLLSAARRSLLMPCVRICSTWYGWMGQQRIRAHYIQLLVTSSCCSSSVQRSRHSHSPLHRAWRGRW